MFDKIIDKVYRVLLLLGMAAIIVFIIVWTAKIAVSETYTCVVHRGEWVWIRSGASYEAPQIGQLRYGYEVDVSEFKDGFAHIRWTHSGEVTEGYVAAQYLEISIPETMYRVITTGPLAKRETPRGRLMCWIKPGSKISVLGWRYASDGTMWAKVYKGGYVCAAYLGEM